MVNNAGVTSVGLIDWMPFEEFKQMADVNLWGLIDVTKTFLPLVKKAEGRVVNISSMLGQCDVKPKYHKIPVISFGLIPFHKGFCVGLYKWRSLVYLGGLISGIKKKNVSKRATGVLIEIFFLGKNA